MPQDMQSRLAVVESRVERLETEMRAIHQLAGQMVGLQTTIENIAITLAKQDVKIADLTNMASGGRGAFYMFMSIGGAVVALIAWIFSHWSKLQ